MYDFIILRASTLNYQDFIKIILNDFILLLKDDKQQMNNITRLNQPPRELYFLIKFTLILFFTLKIYIDSTLS